MKAKERALESMQATVSLFYDKHLPGIKVDICGVEPSDVYLQKYFRKTDPLKYAQDSLKWTKCVSDNSNVINQKVSAMIDKDLTYIEKRAIQNKVQADIKVEGCMS